MRITVLSVPDCPNASVAAERITAALAGRPAAVELVEVTGEAQAARLGMTGSPTILLDGVDPFATAGAVPSLSCRIYAGPGGTAGGAPSLPDLRAAISAIAVDRDERGRPPATCWPATDSRPQPGPAGPESRAV
jgi:hypothetical protein